MLAAAGVISAEWSIYHKTNGRFNGFCPSGTRFLLQVTSVVDGLEIFTTSEACLNLFFFLGQKMHIFQHS